MIVHQQRRRAIGSFWNPEPGESADWSPLTAQLDYAVAQISRGILVEMGAPNACRTTSAAFNAACMAPVRAIAVRRIAFGGAWTGENADAIAELARGVVSQFQMPASVAITDYERSLFAPGGPFEPTMVGYEIAPGVVIDVPIGGDGQAAPGAIAKQLGDAWRACVQEHEAARNWAGARGSGRQPSPATLAALLELRDSMGWQQGSTNLGQDLPAHWDEALAAMFAPCYASVREAAEQYAATGSATVPGSFEPAPIDTTPPPSPVEPPPDAPPDVHPTPPDVPVVYTPDAAQPVAPPARSTLSPWIIGGALLLLLLLLRGRRA